MNPIVLTRLAQFMSTSTTQNKFSINNFLNNLKASLGTWGSVIVVIIGLVMVIVAVFNIAKGLMSGGRGQVNWVMNIALFFIGGALAFGGGWALLQNVSGAGSATIMDLGSTIIYSLK